jgi:subtilisin family serine protease
MMLRTLALAVLGLAVTLAALAAPPSPATRSQAAPPPPSFAPERGTSARTGDVIVRFRQGTALSAMGTAFARANTSVRASTAGSGLVLVTPAPGESVDDVVARLSADPSVEFAEPNTTVHATLTPNDPLYASYQSAKLTQIGVPPAWDATTGGAGTTVAVIDTGVDATHEDLSGRVLAGYNFVANNTNAADDDWHGTFVAGIIAAGGNNSKGIAGVCWTCKILPVKVLDASGNGTMFAAAQGIDWAVAHGAKVINMSFGGDAADQGLQTSVNNAWNAGVVLVGASGNDDHGAVLYPAAFSNVVAVGSVSGANGLSSFSNIGPELDLVAPGESVMSTVCGCGGNTKGYGTGSGTSFATPEVAGIAALMIGAGTTSNATIVSTLKSTATDLGAAGFDNSFGSGLVNAGAAITPTPDYEVSWGATSIPATMSAGASVSISASFTNTGSLTWQATGTNPFKFSYHWLSGTCPGSSTVVWNGARTSLPSDIASGGTVTGLSATVAAPATPGTYCLALDLLREGITWFSWKGADTSDTTVTVSAQQYAVTWGPDAVPSTMTPGQSGTYAVSFTNSGATTWTSGGANPYRLSYHWLDGSCPGTTNAVWNGTRTALPGDIAPAAAVANLGASVTAPGSPGTYCFVFDLVREGVTWFSWKGAATKTKTVTVAPRYAVTWGADNMPSTVSAGSSTGVTVSFTNAGTLTWTATGTNPYRFSYHWLNGACPGTTTVVWNGNRTPLPGDIAAGASVSSLGASIDAPSSAGTYCLVFDLLRENVTWFTWQGAAPSSHTITVN